MDAAGGLFEHMPTAVIVLETDTTDEPVLMSCNRLAAELLGDDIESRIGAACSDLWPDGDFSSRIADCAQNGGETEEAIRLPVAEKTIVCQPFMIDQTTIGVVLEEKDSRPDWRQAMLDSNPNIIGIALPDTSLIYLNPAAYDQLGYEPGEVTCIADAQPELADEAVGAVMGEAGYWIGESEFVRKDGSIMPVHQVLTAVKDDAGELVYLTTITRDITKDKELETERNWMSQIIETSPYIIGIAAPDGELLYVNPATYDLLGYKPGEVTNITVAQPEMGEGAMEALMSQGVWIGEVDFYCKDGTRIPMMQVMTTVNDEDGNMQYITSIAQDITEQKEAEARIRAQNEAIMELSTPVITVWDKILLLPLVGSLDTSRTEQMTDKLLDNIIEQGARVAILDVTGIPLMDTSVARHLMTAVDAARILGAEVIITGFASNAAKTLAQLGVDFSALRTRSSLRAGIQEAFAMTGHNISVLHR